MFIYTDIVEKFSCEMCGQCCRNSWRVTVDEQSYLRNQALFVGTGREWEFNQAFNKIAHSEGYGEYAYIAKQPAGGCWFLDTDNRCRLHKEGGHRHLDAVCQTFPRYPMSTARGIEITLSFSCPAVLKLADRIEPLKLIRSEQSPIELLPDNYVAEIHPGQQPLSNPLRYYFELEMHFIDILQCRGLSLPKRLTLLNDTAREINSFAKETDIAGKLTYLFNRNYDDMEALNALESCVTASALIENFFVSFVFKKPFYIYGVEKTLRLFNYMWQQINSSQNIIDTIRQLEFQYGHDRTALSTKV